MTREQATIPNIEYTTATGRYDESRSPIDLIVLHSTAGDLNSAISLFGSNPQAGKETSAHYIVDNDGKLYQGLEEYFTAYHCGNLEKNRRSIGIEHVDNGANVKLHTDAQYAMSAKLVKDICQFYNIPIDSNHIVPHSSIVATACPNGLAVERIIREAKGESMLVNDCPAKLAQIIEERDRLNGVITGKDQQISKMASEYSLLQSQANTLALQGQECQKQSLIYKEAYDALPALKEELVHLADAKIKQAEEISELTKQVGYWTTKYNNLKKPGLKFIQAAVIALCEKLGVQL